MTPSTPDVAIRTEGLGKRFGGTTALTALDLTGRDGPRQVPPGHGHRAGPRARGPLGGMALPAGGVAAAMLHLALLGLVFGAPALAIGAASGHVAASRAMPAVVAVVACLVNALGPQVSWLRPVRKLSPSYQFNGHDPLRNGISTAAALVAVATVVVLVVAAVAGFRRRDVAA